jgi:hypothetical protein
MAQDFFRVRAYKTAIAKVAEFKARHGRDIATKADVRSLHVRTITIGCYQRARAHSLHLRANQYRQRPAANQYHC